MAIKHIMPIQLEMFAKPYSGEYNVQFDYEWRTNTQSLSGVDKAWIEDNCYGRWGWHWDSSNGKDVILTFSHIDDLVLTKLCLGGVINK